MPLSLNPIFFTGRSSTPCLRRLSVVPFLCLVLSVLSGLSNFRCRLVSRSMHAVVYSSPLRASSTFLAASPALNPPFDTQIRCPSASSNLSSCEGHAQGQWCGKWTHAREGGCVSQIVGRTGWLHGELVALTYRGCLDKGNSRSRSAGSWSGSGPSRWARSAAAAVVGRLRLHRQTFGRRNRIAPRRSSLVRRGGVGQRRSAFWNMVEVILAIGVL